MRVVLAPGSVDGTPDSVPELVWVTPGLAARALRAVSEVGDVRRTAREAAL